jgi:hypothetical protein
VSTYSTPKNVATWSVLPKKLLYQTTPEKTAPSASTPSGTSMVIGLSWAWSCVCLLPRASPKKVRNISRHE